MTWSGFVDGCEWVSLALIVLGVAGVLTSEAQACCARRRAEGQRRVKTSRLVMVCTVSSAQRQIDWLERQYGDLTPHEETRVHGRARR